MPKIRETSILAGESSSDAYMPSLLSDDASSTSGLASGVPLPIASRKVRGGQTIGLKKSQLERDNAILKRRLDASNRLVERYKRKLSRIMPTAGFAPDDSTTQLPIARDPLGPAKMFPDSERNLLVNCTHTEDMDSKIDGESMAIKEECEDEMSPSIKFEECFVSGVPEPEECISEPVDDNLGRELTEEHYSFLPTPLLANRDFSCKAEPPIPADWDEDNDSPPFDLEDQASADTGGDFVNTISILRTILGHSTHKVEIADDDYLTLDQDDKAIRQLTDDDEVWLMNNEDNLQMAPPSLEAMCQESSASNYVDDNIPDDEHDADLEGAPSRQSAVECEMLVSNINERMKNITANGGESVLADALEIWVIEDENSLQAEGISLPSKKQKSLNTYLANPKGNKPDKLENVEGIATEFEDENSDVECEILATGNNERFKKTMASMEWEREKPLEKSSRRNVHAGVTILTEDNQIWVIEDENSLQAAGVYSTPKKQNSSKTSLTNRTEDRSDEIENSEDEITIVEDENSWDATRLPLKLNNQKPTIMCGPKSISDGAASAENSDHEASPSSRSAAGHVASATNDAKSLQVAVAPKPSRRKQSIVCKSDRADEECLVVTLTHDESDETESEFHCKECSAAFVDKSKLEEHRRQCPPKKFTCKICMEMFPTLSALSVHKRTHSSTQSFQCLECDVVFCTEFGLECHTCDRDRLGFKCSHCKSQYSSEWYLVAHKCNPLEKEQTQTQTRMVCKICDLNLSRRFLFRHTAQFHPDELRQWNVVDGECRDADLCD